MKYLFNFVTALVLLAFVPVAPANDSHDLSNMASGQTSEKVDDIFETLEEELPHTILHSSPDLKVICQCPQLALTNSYEHKITISIYLFLHHLKLDPPAIS